jgi:hypothetical protein
MQIIDSGKGITSGTKKLFKSGCQTKSGFEAKHSFASISLAHLHIG